MPGIEFVGGGAGDAPDEDVLDTGPHRPVPRWVWWVAALAAAAVVAALVAGARSSPSRPAAASSPPAPASSAAPASGGSSSGGPSPDAAPITSLASDGTSLYWVAGGSLHRGGPAGRPPDDVDLPEVAGTDVTQVLPDPDAATVWVVRSSSTGGGPARVDGFAAGDLSPLGFGSLDAPVAGATVFNGALWVITGGQLRRFTTSGPPVTITAVDRTARDLVVADDELLYVEGGNGSAIGSWTPSGLGRPVVLKTVDNALTVVGDTVFVLGTAADGASELDILNRFSSTVQRQGLETGLEGMLHLAATGPHSVIVRGLGQAGDELACVTTVGLTDGADGAQVQALASSTSPLVAVLGGAVYEADGDTVVPVTFDLGRCST